MVMASASHIPATTPFLAIMSATTITASPSTLPATTKSISIIS
jgi:hypothetical protein